MTTTEERNAQLAALIEGMPDLVAALDTELRYIAFSRSYRDEFAKVYGRAIDVGTRLTEALGHIPDELVRVLNVWERAISGEEFTVEQEFGDPRRGRHFYRITFSRIRDEQGSLLGAVMTGRDITELRRSEEVRRESETRYRTLFEKMSEGFALGEPILDADDIPVDFRFLEANPAFERQTGLTREALNRPFSEVLPHLEQSWIDIYGGVALSGKEAHFENYNRDTGRHYGVFCFSPEPGRFAILFRNITEQKEKEERLRRNSETFHHLIRNNPFGVYIVDADFRLRLISAGTRHAFRNVHPLLGRDFSEIMRTLWPEEVAAHVVAHFRHTLETGEPYVQKSMVEQRVDVEEVEAYDWRIERITLPDGRFGVVCYFYDLSERRRWEAALRESEERFRNTADHSPVMIWLTQAEGRCIWLNKLWYDFTGQTPEAALGFGWLDAVHPDDAGRSADIFWNANLRAEPFSFEYRLRRRDGVYRWCIDSAAPRFGAEGEFLGYVGSVIDITDRKETEEALRRLTDELERRVERRTAELTTANRELEAFSYSISHDLRAPLRHIAGFVEMLETVAGDALDETGRRYVRIISDAARRMGFLIDDLLTFSRIGRTSIKFVPVRLDQLLEQSRRELDPETKGRHIDWRIDLLPQVQGDPVLLRTVMTNLLSNALKYTRGRSPAVIEIGCREEGAQVVCRVKDNGAGFDMRYAGKLFGVFQRLHRSEEFEGTGIGLASVKRIIERHGGRVWAEGEVGRGAAFHFTLPSAGTESGGGDDSANGSSFVE